MTSDYVSPEEFLKEVQRLAVREGFVMTDPSFPGLILIKPGPFPNGGRLIFVDVRGSHGRQTSGWADWHLLLESLGAPVEVYTWRPKDRTNIHGVLKQSPERNAS